MFTYYIAYLFTYIQAMSVHASHPHRSSTDIPIRLCIQFLQPVADTAEVDYRLSGLSPVHTSNMSNSLKLLLHTEHLYSLSPVWTLMYLFRFED